MKFPQPHFSFSKTESEHINYMNCATNNTKPNDNDKFPCICVPN